MKKQPKVHQILCINHCLTNLKYLVRSKQHLETWIKKDISHCQSLIKPTKYYSTKQQPSSNKKYYHQLISWFQNQRPNKKTVNTLIIERHLNSNIIRLKNNLWCYIWTIWRIDRMLIKRWQILNIPKRCSNKKKKCVLMKFKILFLQAISQKCFWPLIEE